MAIQKNHFTHISSFLPASVPVILAAVCITSLVLWAGGNHSKKYTMFFEHTDLHEIYCETRLISRVNGKSETAVFLDELAAGPLSDRYSLLFPRGTVIVSSFERNDTLYINLSEQAVSADTSSPSILRGAEILAKNVFSNFRNIDNIKIYIMGREIYGGGDLFLRKKKR